MKKKILSLCLVMALAAVAVVGGTLAYFTDTDSAKNVMTTGSVSIIQNEQQRDEEGNMENFEDGKALYPVTGDTNKDGKIDTGYTDDLVGKTFEDEDGNTQTIVAGKDANGGTTKVFSLNNNVVDKIVTVTNNGENEAYIRTLFAFEVPVDEEEKWIDVINNSAEAYCLYTVMHEGATPGQGYTLPVDENGDYITITLGEGEDAVTYLICDYYYKNDSKLAAGETSHPSLKQIYLSSKADNEQAAELVGADGKYSILVLSQAAQTAGFDDAKTALDTAFGEVNAENSAKWFADVE